MKHRKHKHRLDPTQVLDCNPDKNERFILRHCAIYLDRLLAAYSLIDSETITMLAYVLGPEINGIEKALKKGMSLIECEELGLDMDDDTSDAIYKILRHAGKKAQREFIAISRSAIATRDKALAYAGKSETEKKLDTLEKMFGLNNEEKTLAMFIYINTVWHQAESYFVDHLSCQGIFGRRYLKTILQMNDLELNRILSGTLARIGYFEMDRHSFTLSEDYLFFFQKPVSDLLKKKDFARFSAKTIPLENHLVEPAVTDNILNLLKTKQKSANHILLYGPPGTGKTSYALGLVQKLGIPAYEILQEEFNHARNRRASIIACMNMTNAGDGSLIVVDEADNLLKTQNSWFSRGETQDKGWLNQLLEESGTRMIWITNSIDEIEGSVLRRFAFSIHFRAFSRQQRIGLWESVLTRHRVIKQFSNEEIIKLAISYPVSAAIINMAVSKALETSSARQAIFKDILKMNLDAHLTLLNSGEKPKNADKFEDNYSIDGLHIEGNLPMIMEHVEAFDRRLRGTDQHTVRNFNLLFYGSPGTGKSELARYLAGHLKRELMVKRISDIVTPYVGETEQNISRVFSEAEAAEAVLVIDEADSFLFNRSNALRSWEISHTNEFLTQMERFRGILICTTNRFEGLDQASIRRFNYKICFHCLKPEGNIIFYNKLLSPLILTDLNKEDEYVLENISDLTPGDFRIVRDRFAIFEPARVSHSMMIEALREEARIKKTQEGKKTFGFMRSVS